MSYYRKIRELRKDNDLTQHQVAEYLHMKQPRYYRYEQRLRDIPSDILIAIALLCKTSTDYILWISDKKWFFTERCVIQTAQKVKKDNG